MSNSVVCSEVVTPFELHCRLGHPFLPLLKKLYPQFSNLSSLNRESCQYPKIHRVHLSLRVNKQASAPLKLVHSDVWDPCLILSPIEFKYLFTFVDDLSRVTWLYLMKSCFEFFSHFSAFCSEIQTQFHVHVQTLRVIMPRNICGNLFSPLCYMGFSIRPRVLIHPLRIG